LRALVLGAGGQLGTELARLLGAENALPEEALSILDPAAVDDVLAARRPDFVFNCAAYNAVDRAENEREKAFAINSEGPRVLAAACRKTGATLVHYSTNFVFDGSHDRPYVEADEPGPISVYGESKLAGERSVHTMGALALIIRTAALFGGPLSFPYRILERARGGAALPVVSDQTVNPTFARDLAAASVELATAGTLGIVHVVGEGCCGWDEFARATLQEAGLANRVEPVRTGDFPAQARRPKNGCLATTRYRPLRPWREALHEAMNP
jgi:dTDP-4-dehydrorhamnose reductase